MNLALIGMSGAGKSYIGKRVAERLGLVFLDVDAEIEKDAAQSLPAIIADIGDDAFVALESATTVARTKGKDGLLISTGGSVVYSAATMEYLRSISRVVYLHAPFSTIEQRVRGNHDRMGRIVGLGGRSLKELYEEREPLYERFSHVIVDVSGSDTQSSEEAVVRIARTANS